MIQHNDKIGPLPFVSPYRLSFTNFMFYVGCFQLNICPHISMYCLMSYAMGCHHENFLNLTGFHFMNEMKPLKCKCLEILKFY